MSKPSGKRSISKKFVWTDLAGGLVMSKNEFSEEIKILLDIRKHCLHCTEDDKELVENCPADWKSGKSACALHDYRAGPLTTAKRFKKRLLAVVHENCIRCTGKEKEVQGCTCDGSGGYRRCNLYDYRNGNKGA